MLQIISLLIFLTQVELSSMFDAFFGRPAEHRLFIVGPLERVAFCEVRKFFETEASRLEPNGRNRINIGGLNVLESDVVDVLNNFRHRQFIFAKFHKSSVTDRLMTYFNWLIIDFEQLLFDCKMT